VSQAGVVVPIRAFALGKARLAEHLDPAARAALGRHLAQRVVAAAGTLDVAVVTSDAEVQEWASAQRLALVDDPGSLDAAADAGRGWAVSRGHRRVVVVHADLPHARSLAALVRDAGQPIVTAVPCHRDDGTPVLSVPTAREFTFAYGPGSFRRHAAEARRRGMGFRAVRDAELAFDVDVPSDLEDLDDLDDLTPVV